MNKAMIKNGFIAAGLMNIGGVLLFSRAFTNEAINQADSVVMSNFGLLMIMVWGLAYISVYKVYEQARWLIAVFAIEKLVYIIVWAMWIANNDLNSLYSKDLFAGVFYTIYGPNDILFMLFFSWVFFRTKVNAN
ncbi:MAG: hypothetical protein JKY52_20550 [Flavobacteriales bacterium]|nr:hypothetical protein [Flavobacteriales bacterium]